MLPLLKNRYRILRSLNSGGFGETFLAEDTDMPSARRCVIKKLIPIASDPQIYQLVKERFGREAVILEKLGESNSYIPTLYAYFEDNSHFYLVQEWIEGKTLIEKVKIEGVLLESSVREILTNILSVLDFVHSHHIVHRDIKPENIIIRASDNKPVLIDFGAVKETMGTVVTTSGRNSNSIVIGTPGFMPSEQSVGRPVYSSDLYSLGLTAIYLLTGKYPQEFATHPATGEILWRNDATSVSSAFADILDRAIQSHSRERFSSAKEMLDAIQKLTSINANISPISPQESVRSTTIISSETAQVTLPPTNLNPSSQGLKDWQKILITSSIVGCFVMGALVLNNYVNRSSNSQQTVAKFTPSPNTKPTDPPPAEPIAKPSPQSSSQPNRNIIPQEAVTSNPETSNNVIWRSQSDKTKIPNLDRICWGSNRVIGVETVFDSPSYQGNLTFNSPKAGGCIPGDSLQGYFDLYQNGSNCQGDITVTWLENNKARIAWQIINLGSACRVSSSEWQIETYPVKP